MKKGFISLMLLLAAGWMIAGCGDKKDENASTVPALTGAPGVSPGEIAPDALVAQVNGKEITGVMLMQQLNAMMQQYAQQVPPDQLSKLQPMLRQQAVAALVNQELLLEEADREGISPDKAAVDAEIEKIVAQFPSREQFDAQMAQAGVSAADLHRDIARNLKIQTLVDKLIPEGEEVTDEDVETFYAENTQQFKQPEQVEASHILIKFSPEDTEEQKSEKHQKLADLKKQIEEGADFAELATANSDDVGSAANGGDLGYFGRGQMIPPFEEAAFSLEDGDLSEIIETQYGYHLIKVTGHKEAGVVPLEEIKEQVILFLTNQKKQKVIGEYLQTLRDGAAIEYGAGFQPPPPPPPGQLPPPQPPK
ncbi:MAG: peptidylprolyl isomerase [Candidatus Auribacterota bacterium]|nr:peptidylprolyl isomerase [Candidatus Auribacterota bacterium]